MGTIASAALGGDCGGFDARRERIEEEKALRRFGPMVSEVIGPVAGCSVNTEGDNSPRGRLCAERGENATGPRSPFRRIIKADVTARIAVPCHAAHESPMSSLRAASVPGSYATKSNWYLLRGLLPGVLERRPSGRKTATVRACACAARNSTGRVISGKRE